jgi:thioredoxin reductase
MTDFDVVVVGGGAAGLSAALVLSRAQRRVAVVDAGHPRNAPAAHMHGFLSRDGMAPAGLLAIGRDEVTSYGGEIHSGTVVTITRDSDHEFRVRLEDGAELKSRRLLITSGLRDELPVIPGVRERFGIDVLHCPYCHGYEVRDDAVGVIGGSPNSLHQAQLVRQWADDVVFFSNGTALTDQQREEFEARAIGVVEDSVARLVIDDDRLAAVELSDGSLVPRSAVFVAPRFIANDETLSQLGCDRDVDGLPVTDSTGRTSVAGVWVAGNVSNPRAQVITAAGEGSAAAIALNADLVADDVERAIREFRRGA